jgi:hypothetical protein
MTMPKESNEPDTQSGLARKSAVAVAGSAVTAAGVVMLVVPGPGIITIAVGLGILGSEFKRPRRVLDRVKNRISGADS